MTERVKTRERVLFDKEKKIKILHKSKGVCSHCGKLLDVETMTVDHVIPLSKGGTNELKNLVALCNDCNQSKNNYVVDPEDYFKHLDWVYLKDLIKSYEYYSENVKWVSKRQVFSEDMQCITAISNAGIFLDKGKSLVKAKYSDLDDIYYAYIKVHDRKCNKRYSREERSMVKSFIEFIFINGCFYIYRNQSGDVSLVLPVFMSLIKHSDEEITPMLFVSKILMVYKKPELSSLFIGFVSELCRKGLNWFSGNSVGVQVSFSVFGVNLELERALVFIRDMLSLSEKSYVNIEDGTFLKVLVYVGKLEKFVKSGEIDKKLSKDEYMEEWDRIVNFFKDLNVVELNHKNVGYFLVRGIETDGYER